MIDKSYIKIKQLGDKENDGILTKGDYIFIQEKIDGANIRFQVKDGYLFFGSHKTFIENIDLPKYKNYKKCIDFIIDKFNQFPSYDIELLGKKINRLIFFGECCIKHTISYNWNKIPPFLGFDIYDLDTECYLSYSQMHAIFVKLGFNTVPLLYSGIWEIDLDEFNLSVENIISKYYDGNIEGIVIKNYSKQLFAKKVSERFKEKNKENFGIHKQFAKNDNEKLLVMYCTNPRIEKIILKLRDTGNPVDMKLMAKLPNSVWDDICEENSYEILKSDYVIDIRHLRKMVAHRCLAVLKQLMERNAVSQNDESEMK